MGPVFVVVAAVIGQEPLQVALVEDDNSANRARTPIFDNALRSPVELAMLFVERTI
jgi:hypothetical protein